MQIKEEWKWIEGFEHRYQISNMGRIKSFLRNPNGEIRKNTNRLGWYFTVNLIDELGVSHTERIHRLVCKAFIGDIPRGYHVHHKDGDKQNNRVDNLEIVHPQKHAKETIKHNANVLKGINEYNKYVRPKSIRQYTLDNHFLAEYVSSKIASDFTGVCQRNILQVCDNQQGRKQAGGYIWRYAESEVV